MMSYLSITMNLWRMFQHWCTKMIGDLVETGWQILLKFIHWYLSFCNIGWGNPYRRKFPIVHPPLFRNERITFRRSNTTDPESLKVFVEFYDKLRNELSRQFHFCTTDFLKEPNIEQNGYVAYNLPKKVSIPNNKFKDVTALRPGPPIYGPVH